MALCRLGLACLGLSAGCALGVEEGESLGEAVEADCHHGPPKAPQPSPIAQAFADTTLGTNGRSCATCHVLDDETQLSPQNALSRFNPADPLSDPLFRAIDADDPAAPPGQLTFEHLKRGLVRIPFGLAPNVDLIDADGNVLHPPPGPFGVTAPVWHSVPSIKNTALTAPYQFAGLVDNLPDQVIGAVLLHAEGAAPPDLATRNAIAAFELTSFTSPSVAVTAFNVQHNLPFFDPDPHFAPHSDERHGKALFNQICARCHGGAEGNRVTDPGVLADNFIELHPDGTPVIDPTTGRPKPTAPPAGTTFLNTGVTHLTSKMEAGLSPNTLGVSMPRYRFRFYTDATKKVPVADLPPRCASSLEGRFGKQCFTVDPGRAVVDGDPRNFEAFDIPQLRGVSRTAPYFHDNSAKDLETVVNLYSRFILPKFPSIGRPAVHPAESPCGPKEALTKKEKRRLLAYLKKI